jgi:hypothetical protein
MAARTSIAVQRLQAQSGQEITFQAFDFVNGMQCQSLGIEVAIVKLGAGEQMTVTVPSVADPFNRLGDLTKTLNGPIIESFGPYPVPTVFGDGASKLFFDGTNGTGSAVIAVIEVG